MRNARRRAWLCGAAAAALPAFALAGCSGNDGPDHDGPDAPIAAPLRAGPAVRRVAWVFGSGGPRGFVHVGVVKALKELALAPDMIVGASVGALVGTLCAGGVDARRIERMALDLQPWELVRWNPFGAERWSGGGLATLVNREIGERPLDALGTPMACAVQRLRDGEVLAFTRGNAGLAVQASAAIQEQFAPVTIRGERYADADLRMPLPVRLARALGASVVLAVDASAYEDRAPAGSERFRASDLRKRALTEPDARLADLVLHPDIGYWTGFSRSYREQLIGIGYRDTLAAATALRALHG
jgi:NTE family protein